MAINKVVYGNKTLIDLTDDNVSPADVMKGKTFHTKDGERTTGTFELPTAYVDMNDGCLYFSNSAYAASIDENGYLILD